MVLDGEQLAVQSAARDFAAAELAPHAEQWDDAEGCPTSVLRALADLGFMGMQVPAADGGTVAGHLLNAIVMEEIAAGCGGVSTIMHVHNSVCAAIVDSGAPSLRARLLPRMTTGECIGAFCVTEPEAGSDTSMLRTVATRVAGGWRLNGAKQFISNGSTAGLAIVLASTEPLAKKKGFTLFAVPTTTAGFRVGRTEKKLGQKCADTSEIFLDDCLVSEDDVLGQPGSGYGYALRTLSAGRVSVAAQAVGMARSAYAYALSYAQHRKAYGQEIVKHQAVSFRLADMLMGIELARQYTYHAAALLDSGQSALREAAIAKCFAAEMAENVGSGAIATLGGYGYLAGPIERIYRDVRACQIYEGTGDIQRLIISRDLELQ